MLFRSLIPDTYTAASDSVYNAKTGSFVPAHIRRVSVVLDSPMSTAVSVLSICCEVIRDLMIVVAFFWFLRFIGKVNKGEIFSGRNIRRLRWIGGLLIGGFLLSLVPIIKTITIVNNGFEMGNYKLQLLSLFDVMPLLLGLFSLLTAQIFAMALRMKEEQELTI